MDTIVTTTTMHRSAVAVSDGAGQRIAAVTFATERPVQMTATNINYGSPFWEVLSLQPDHVRLERYNAGASVLDSHGRANGPQPPGTQISVRDVLGAVVEGSAMIVNRTGVCKIKFSQRVTDVYQDVVDRVIRAVSVGYRVHAYRQEADGANELPTFRAVDWEPYELSIVTVPADPGATFRQYGHLSTEDADRARRLRFHKLTASADESGAE